MLDLKNGVINCSCGSSKVVLDAVHIDGAHLFNTRNDEGVLPTFFAKSEVEYPNMNAIINFLCSDCGKLESLSISSTSDNPSESPETTVNWGEPDE